MDRAQPRPRAQAAASAPCCPPEGVPRLGGEQVPGRDEVAGRVADADGAEVQHGVEPAPAGEQIAGHQVGVDPCGRTGPRGRGERRLPGGGGGGGVDRAAQLVERGARHGVGGGQGHTPVGGRPVGQPDPAQRCHEGAEVGGQGQRIGEAVGARGFAVEPALHHPGPREALAGRRAPGVTGMRAERPAGDPRRPIVARPRGCRRLCRRAVQGVHDAATERPPGAGHGGRRATFDEEPIGNWPG